VWGSARSARDDNARRYDDGYIAGSVASDEVSGRTDCSVIRAEPGNMKIDQAIATIKKIGIVPVIRAANVEEAQKAVQAVCAGGIPIVEITMTVPNATEVIRGVVEQHGNKVLTGAGTVLTGEQAQACLEAGAQFLVSPGISLPVLEVARSRGKLCIPGALTPTELMNALSAGAEVVKIFPCGNVGGPKYLKALRGPFPNVALIPTGGVNATNASEYFAAGAFALGVGADLVDLAALRAGKPEKVSEAARQLAEAARAVRG
jgi:2-dehydro-3-deoxyphosphogluconate aldolase/(4S)-4-hydroxy-2-oxoglutarate aldolase